MFHRIFLTLSLALFCVGCGYHTGSQARESTLYIPYVEGDYTGKLTQQLVEKAATSKLFTYCFSEDATYHLVARIVGRDTETIGYQKDIQNTGIRRKILAPTESRQILSVEVELYKEGKRVFGPKQISSSVDFDYFNPESIVDVSFVNLQNRRETTSNFSLGQLESFSMAQESAQAPLYEKIAEKIIDVIFVEW